MTNDMDQGRWGAAGDTACVAMPAGLGAAGALALLLVGGLQPLAVACGMTLVAAGLAASAWQARRHARARAEAGRHL